MHFSNDKDFNDHFDLMREHIHTQLKILSGLDDVSGIELAGQIRAVARFYEKVVSKNTEEDDISGPRWGVLVRLYGEEKQGNTHGLTPTALSHSQRVSKNSISALLRGLEEQGLICRELDSADRRIFRIRLTQDGRNWVQSTAPLRLTQLNQMSSVLSDEERCQLTALLEKLHRSLRAAYCAPDEKPDGG